MRYPCHIGVNYEAIIAFKLATIAFMQADINSFYNRLVPEYVLVPFDRHSEPKVKLGIYYDLNSITI